MRTLHALTPALSIVLATLIGCSTSSDDNRATERQADGNGSTEETPTCDDTTAPKISSSLADIGVPLSAKSASRTIEFTEPVTIVPGGIVISPGATVSVKPALPATSKTFTVDAFGLLAGTDYVLTVVPGMVMDRCGNTLAARATANFVAGCEADQDAPALTSATSAVAIPIGATSVTYELTFDEVVSIAPGGITASNGALVGVSPPLPARASSFRVELSRVVASKAYDLTVQASAVADACSNALPANVVIPFVGTCLSDNRAPTITSSSAPRRFTDGAASHTFSFDEPVTIAAGGISVDNGAELRITPELPATATSFEVEVLGLSDDKTYTLTAAAGSIKDACGAAPEASQEVQLVQCAGDTTAPKLLSDTQTLSCNSAAHTYTMKFDERVALAANAIAIDGGATITSITPALPAVSDTFTIALDNLTATHALSIAAGELTDECGNRSSSALTVTAGVGAATGTQQLDYSGSIVPFVVPSCPLVTIEAWGAAGNASGTSAFPGGLGARMKGEFSSLPSRELRILVGQRGGTPDTNGGGGGSFVVTSANAPLVIAGGGGGSGTSDGAHKHGTTATSGQSCPNGDAGGIDGNGGAAGGAGYAAGAGGGLLTSGANGSNAGAGGASFLLGGAGGAGGFGIGGFGGGGHGSGSAVGGGGGGYSGGGSCTNGDVPGAGSVGAGGGSFNAGTNQDNASGVNDQNGKVVITWQ